jgi:hypothetical protein
MLKFGTSLRAKMEDLWYGQAGPGDFPDLLSIHIPKTAGLSFRAILYRQYGQHRVLAKNQGALRRAGHELGRYYRKRHRVVHGHLPYPLLRSLHGPNTRVITWLREPVSRVVSNYYYNITHEFPKRQQEDPNAQMLTLEEFIERPMRQNVMSRFLEGIGLQGLFFFGFQEDFEGGLDQLSEQMGWTLSEEDRSRRVNDNRKIKASYPQPSPALVGRIRQLNQSDIALYEQAKALWERR